jgi:uncharacterized protein (DUF4415 family)
MSENRHFGANLTDDPDDAPELLAGFFEDAEIRRGETVIRPARRPGRPKSDAPKELISVRLDPDVLSKLRESGSGWQSRVNGILRKALGLGGKRVA